MNSNTLARKLLAALFLGFVLLFFVRFLLSFLVDFEDKSEGPSNLSQHIPLLSLSSISYEKAVSNNLRQLNWDLEAPLQAVAAMATQLEVYAKEATINTYTPNFDAERAKVMAIIKDNEIKIRIENSESLKPNRKLRLILKVPEDQFDLAVEALKEIGTLDNFIVTKEDKSEEARNLIAQRKSLETYKVSLAQLRSQPGTVEEFVKLEAQIQEIEQQIQGLGVQLGDYIQEVSYSNISFALVEKVPFNINSDEYPLTARIFDTMAWTIQWYFTVLFAAAFAFICYISVRTLKSK